MWKAMLLLGTYHGINPGMGWLFAVALGMQEGSARGVWRALPPIAFGHALAVAVVVAGASVAQAVMPLAALKIVVAAILGTFGLYRLWRHRHPRFGGMRVGFRDLTLWSFLMASAHGAGFMALPFIMPLQADMLASAGEHAGHMMAAGASLPVTNAMAVGVHSLAYLAMMTAAAYAVYRKFGLALLRTGWLNMDWLWACSLLVAGVIVMVE